VQPAGAMLRGVYRANNDRPPARWITGLGDPGMACFNAGKLGTARRCGIRRFVERLQWTVYAGTTLAAWPFTISDGATSLPVSYLETGGAVVSAGRVIADVIWARGAQAGGVDAAREIRGMGPNVRRSKWFQVAQSNRGRRSGV